MMQQHYILTIKAAHLKRVWTGIILAAIVFQVNAQKKYEPGILNELKAINALYQPGGYLSFDLNIIARYEQDTADNEPDTLQYRYQLHNHFYRLQSNSNEYIKGNSYNLLIDHERQTVIATKTGKEKAITNMVQLPDPETMEQAGIQKIAFAAADSGFRRLQIQFAPESGYTDYNLLYNSKSNRIEQISYTLTKPDEEGILKKLLVIFSFTNYSTDVFSDVLLNENNYITNTEGNIKGAKSCEGYEIIVTEGG